MSERPSEEFSEKPLPTPSSAGAEGSTEFSEKPLSPPAVESEPDAEPEPDAAQLASLARILELQARGHKGANWFFWVAGLSIVNSISVHGGMTGYFVVGLGVTLVVDSIAKAIGEQHPEFDIGLKAFGIGFAVVAALVVTFFGWFARKGVLIIFAIGMILYLFDGLLFLILQDLMSVAFHGFALFWMWSGFSAFRQIRAIEAELREQVEPRDYPADDES